MAYNGYKNYETWNVALWLSNNPILYGLTVNFMKSYKGRKPYKDFVKENDFQYCYTLDDVALLSSKLSYSQLNRVMRDFEN